MNEEWRTIPGFSKYKICTDGKIVGPRGWVLSPQRKEKDGRLFVCIVADNETGSRPRTVHRLLAMAFIRVPRFGEVVRHLNDDPTDNRLENLAIGTPQDNADDRTRNNPEIFHGMYKYRLIDTEQRIIIRKWLHKKSIEIYKEGKHTLKEVGRIFGITESAMCLRIQDKKDGRQRTTTTKTLKGSTNE